MICIFKQLAAITLAESSSQLLEGTTPHAKESSGLTVDAAIKHNVRAGKKVRGVMRDGLSRIAAHNVVLGLQPIPMSVFERNLRRWVGAV